MFLQEKLIELVQDAGFIPTLSSNNEIVNVLDEKKKMIGQFKIISWDKLVFVYGSKDKKERECSFDEIGILGVISQLRNIH